MSIFKKFVGEDKVDEKKQEGKTIEDRISELEKEVGIEEEKPKPKPKQKNDTDLYYGLSFFTPTYVWGFGKPTLKEKIKSLRKDVDSLTEKYKLLERFLQIELVDAIEKTETYGRTNEKKVKEYRKAPKSFEKLEEERRAREAEEAKHCCD